MSLEGVGVQQLQWQHLRHSVLRVTHRTEVHHSSHRTSWVRPQEAAAAAVELPRTASRYVRDSNALAAIGS